MRLGTGLTIIAIGAILAFAVQSSPSWFNIQIAGWVIMVLAGRVTLGQYAASVTDSALVLPYLLFAACCCAVALFAPAVAAAGIAYAYGPGIDPAWELSQSMAVSHRMVLLVRVLVVFALDAALGLAASAASGAAAAVTFGWLVPMTAVSALALAAATVTRSCVETTSTCCSDRWTRARVS